MDVVCSQCGAKYVLKDAEIAAHPKVQFSCAKCGQKTIVEIKRKADETVVMLPLPSFARPNALSSNQKVDRAEGRQRLPESVTPVLSIIAGPDRGISKKLEFASIIERTSL